MTTSDLVVRAAFWHDPAVKKLDVALQYALLHLYAHADRDGIVCLGDNSASRSAHLRSLHQAGHVALYSKDGTHYAWVARSGEQPTRGAIARTSFGLPPPSSACVFECLRRLLGREPDKKEAKRACPRAFGRKRAAAGIVHQNVLMVFEAWRKHQKMPDRCKIGAGSRSVIGAALRECDAETLCDFIDYAYTADDAGPRYWRGGNAQGRTYLGLDNLLRTTRLAGRIEAMRSYTSKASPDASGAGSSLGPLAAYRRRGPAGTNRTSPDGALRLSAQCEKILALFLERGSDGVRTSELAKIARRYGGRLSELRGKGYDIYVAERSSDGNNLYRLNLNRQE